MNVGQLIEELKKFDPSLTVTFYDCQRRTAVTSVQVYKKIQSDDFKNFTVVETIDIS